MSTIYYAVFHCIANNCANMLVGSASASSRSDPAWIQVYRALNHGRAKKRCENRKLMRRFPQEIQDLASLFVDLQIDRHHADYAPRVPVECFSSLTSKFMRQSRRRSSTISRLLQSKIDAPLQSTSCSIAEAEQPIHRYHRRVAKVTVRCRPNRRNPTASHSCKGITGEDPSAQ